MKKRVIIALYLIKNGNKLCDALAWCFNIFFSLSSLLFAHFSHLTFPIQIFDMMIMHKESMIMTFLLCFTHYLLELYVLKSWKKSTGNGHFFSRNHRNSFINCKFFSGRFFFADSVDFIWCFWGGEALNRLGQFTFYEEMYNFFSIFPIFFC